MFALSINSPNPKGRGQYKEYFQQGQLIFHYKCGFVEEYF
jgi:hypothetical protein